jgi:hypothetical protein
MVSGRLDGFSAIGRSPKLIYIGLVTINRIERTYPAAGSRRLVSRYG